MGIAPGAYTAGSGSGPVRDCQYALGVEEEDLIFGPREARLIRDHAALDESSALRCAVGSPEAACRLEVGDPDEGIVFKTKCRGGEARPPVQYVVRPATCGGRGRGEPQRPSPVVALTETLKREQRAVGCRRDRAGFRI